MQQRLAVVTGGVGGLGTAICRYLARAGHRVVAADLSNDDARIDTWRNALTEERDRIQHASLDVTDFDACTELAAAVAEEHGPIDVLVNAAGVTRDGTLKKMSASDWHAVLRVNLDGVFNMTRQVVDGMCERGFGRIVSLSSVNGQTGQLGQTNYSASKAGVLGFSMALARETAKYGVTVNCVSPGYCNTEMVHAIPEKVRSELIGKIPVGRLAEPEEIARVVGFLADEASGYITGANIPVNGGYFMD